MSLQDFEKLGELMMKKIDKDKKFWEELNKKTMKLAARLLDKTDEELQKDIDDHAESLDK